MGIDAQQKVLQVSDKSLIRLLDAISWVIGPYTDYEEEHIENEYPWILELIKARQAFLKDNGLRLMNKSSK